MSRYSIESHIWADKKDVVDALVSYLYNEFYIVDLFKGAKKLEELQKASYEEELELYTVSNLKDGLVMLCCDYDGFHDEKILSISEKLSCDAIYGHNNDGVDNWRWITFTKGITLDGYWYLGLEGQEWVCFPEKYRPLSLHLYEAFDKYSVGYNHASLSDTIRIDSETFIICAKEI
ncbi:MAG: hypothetical protein GY714_07870 [Desulfobacterales bacterium]|nr:hypothetical protein [Desulfobacterales bacterium]MCP4158667.1 hypothetical protein [Deltaproteobacteria bacterium]